MSMTTDLPEILEGYPNIAGSEAALAEAVKRGRARTIYRDNGKLDFAHTRACACIALHMHQPLIPAGGHDVHTAAIISNLQHMMEHQGIGDNHNAPVFEWCYKRMGEIVPELASQGHQPRVMLEYSGTLLWGVRQMGLDVIDKLKTITTHPEYRDYAEWLGCPWGHAVAPSTPVQDYRLHVRAWQHHFAAIFGLEALERVRGFSPSEMALPNHPDVAYEFVKTLRDCGYEWVMVQEHTVEQPADGHHPHRPQVPHRLVCRNSEGEEASIVALVKTQGSDTKLVAQMQPFFEAQGLQRQELAGKQVPSLVTQIADGENGGVMMNEFPPKYQEVVPQASHGEVRLVNGSEYLEHLWASGVQESDLPELQPVHQKKIWDRVQPGCGSQKLGEAIEALRQEDHRFHVEGGSWTDDISWVRGYENVLKPMDEASRTFYERVIERDIPTDSSAYRRALFHLLSSQTSCYRYWGQGIWTDYGQEIARRAKAILENDL